jgi:hypothetical protein
MKTRLFSIAVSLSALLCGIEAQQHTIVLRASRMLDVENGHIVKPAEVLVEGDRIRAAGTSVPRPARAEVIELTQRTC